MTECAKTLWSWTRAMLVLLLFAPFVALQTVAQGTMPTSGPDGIAMVLCTGDRVVEVVLLEDGSVAPVEDQHGHVTCPWAMAASVDVDLDIPEVWQKAVASRDVKVELRRTGVVIGEARRAPPARGPPILV